MKKDFLMGRSSSRHGSFPTANLRSLAAKECRISVRIWMTFLLFSDSIIP